LIRHSSRSASPQVATSRDHADILRALGAEPRGLVTHRREFGGELHDPLLRRPRLADAVERRRDAPLGAIDRARLNVKGSSVAYGHPFAATGTRIVATLAKLLADDANAKRGLISICTAGGMGVTAILEKA
jgi:hypothetical protein